MKAKNDFISNFYCTNPSSSSRKRKEEGWKGNNLCRFCLSAAPFLSLSLSISPLSLRYFRVKSHNRFMAGQIRFLPNRSIGSRSEEHYPRASLLLGINSVGELIRRLPCRDEISYCFFKQANFERYTEFRSKIQLLLCSAYLSITLLAPSGFQGEFHANS